MANHRTVVIASTELFKHNRLTSGEMLSNDRRPLSEGSTSKNRPSHHKYKSSKQFLCIAYLETSTSELKGSKST